MGGARIAYSVSMVSFSERFMFMLIFMSMIRVAGVSRQFSGWED